MENMSNDRTMIYLILKACHMLETASLSERMFLSIFFSNAEGRDNQMITPGFFVKYALKDCF